MARFVLAHPDPRRAGGADGDLACASTPDHPVARRIAAQAQGDLLVLERTINEKTGKLRQDIQVDDVRRTVTFFGSTAGEGGWRVAIVDAVDELNPAGANALLKMLEEPPRRRLLLLVSHSRGAGAADHPLALPRAGAAAACRGRRGARGGRGDRAQIPTTADIDGRGSGRGRQRAARAGACSMARRLTLRNAHHGAARTAARASIRARCMRSAIASPAPIRRTLAAFVDTRECVALRPPRQRARRSARASRASPRSGRRSTRRARRRDLQS